MRKERLIRESHPLNSYLFTKLASFIFSFRLTQVWCHFLKYVQKPLIQTAVYIDNTLHGKTRPKLLIQKQKKNDGWPFLEKLDQGLLHMFPTYTTLNI